MKDQESGKRCKKIAITLGVANSFLISLTTKPVPLSGTDFPINQVQQQKTVKQNRLVQEQVSVFQRGETLTITIKGKPGRHVGIFWGETTRRSGFKLASRTRTVIGRDGTARINLDFRIIGKTRLFMGLATAENDQFSKGLMETEVVEVYVGEKTLIAGHNERGLLIDSDVTYESGCWGMGGAGAGIPYNQRSIPMDVLRLDPAKIRKDATAEELFSEPIKE